MPSAKRACHECPTCGKNFARADKLKHHEKTHTNEKQHQCGKCDNKFQQKSDLKRQEKQVRECRAAQRDYQCTTCGEVFHNLAPFRVHQYTAHTKPSSSKKHSQDEESGKK